MESPSLDVRVGASACLLGRKVRVDGGHKRNRFLMDGLAEHVSWFPVCPEVEMGMGIPRPPLRLIRTDKDRKRGEPLAPFRLIVRKTGEDVTPAMRSWAVRRLDKLSTSDLDGFVFKKDSPTCGIFRVKVYDHNDVPSPLGVGVWAESFIAQLPLLPVEEEGRLNDPALRENFMLRVFTHARWRKFLAEDCSASGLVSFHAAHKMVLLAHDPEAGVALGRIVADAGARPLDDVTAAYYAQLMPALQRPASRGRHVNAMQHLAGFVKDASSPDDKRELEDLLLKYRDGLVPLVVPLTLLRHLLRRHAASEWVRMQTYLDPYPADLMLQNLV